MEEYIFEHKKAKSFQAHLRVMDPPPHICVHFAHTTLLCDINITLKLTLGLDTE